MNGRRTSFRGPDRYARFNGNGEAYEDPESTFQGILGPLREAGPVHLMIIILILLAGAYLRFSALSDAGIGTDEAEKFFAVEDYREGRFWVDLEHPPLEKYLILLSTSILGEDDWTIKLPNAIIGSFTPFLLFLVGMKLGKDPWVGHVSAAIGALSPMLIGYSLVAKEDALVNFLSLAALVFLTVSLEAERSGDRTGSETGERFRLEMDYLKKNMHPRNLDGYALTAAILSGLALASKYTFVFFALSWVLMIFMMDRSWFKRKGPSYLFVMAVVFLILSWYYLNPYWLALGIGHWLWESATGHSTYFMGETYVYPPLWFYPVTFIGRVAPLITLGGSMVAISSLFELPWKRDHPEEVLSFPERIGSRFSKDPLLYMLISWVIVCFLLMTILPFKGIRYVQWIILPMIPLTSFGLWKLLGPVPVRGRGITTLSVAIILMIPALSYADPYYREVTYFLGSDSGMKDLDGQGFREAFDYLEENDLEGKVAVRWEKLADYYWDNVTGPVGNLTEAIEEDVSFILIYRADVNRNLESDFTELARSQIEVFSYEHNGYDLIWLYKMDREVWENAG